MFCSKKVSNNATESRYKIFTHHQLQEALLCFSIVLSASSAGYCFRNLCWYFPLFLQQTWWYFNMLLHNKQVRYVLCNQNSKIRLKCSQEMLKLFNSNFVFLFKFAGLRFRSQLLAHEKNGKKNWKSKSASISIWWREVHWIHIILSLINQIFRSKSWLVLLVGACFDLRFFKPILSLIFCFVHNINNI